MTKKLHISPSLSLPTDFAQWMSDSVAQSASLRDAIREWKDGQGAVEAIDKSYKDLSATCNACHEAYRNE